MSASNGNNEIGKPGSGAEASRDKDKTEGIDPSQDPTRPAASREQVTGQADEEADAQKRDSGARKKQDEIEDIDTNQDGAGAI